MIFALALALSLQGLDRKQDPAASTCPVGPATATEGHRRLAFVVGVSDYRAPSVTDLRGARGDAERFYDLLTRVEGGYGFPKENVCLLRDDEVTTRRFKELFRSSLTARVEDEADVAVFYFAGHGSQADDDNGDEPDEFDETLLLHDSRTSEVPADLSDDELNELLKELVDRTRHAAVILDSCSSGSATRFGAGDIQARFQPPVKAKPKDVAIRGDGDAAWASKDLQGLVAFVAATDGTSALEKAGRGVFTDAILTVLSGPAVLTYAQAARQIPPLVSAASYQVPLFEGNLLRSVFGNDTRERPASWEVRKLTPPVGVELSGPPLPGVSDGAELRIYSGTATGGELRDPGKAKALVVVTGATGLNAKARVGFGDFSSIAVGDLAVLARVGDESLRITVSLRSGDLPGGIPQARAAALRSAIESDPEASMLVSIVEDGGDFELSLSSDGTFSLRGPENRVRNRIAGAGDVPKTLWKHARQRAILQLHGEVGKDFTDQETLRVELVEAPQQIQCADGEWVAAKPNEEQVIPLCHQWNVRVSVAESAPVPLLIGGFILSNDGEVFGIPYNGRPVLLNPGESVTFDEGDETFRAAPPLDVQDHVLIFGTQKTNPVAWHLFAGTAASRGPAMAGSHSSLERALDRYLQAGTRAQTIGGGPREDTTWTMTRLSMRVEANARFLAPKEAESRGQKKREYTIPNFDLRPYLPDDTGSALYKVLMQAHSLAFYSASLADGVPYKQHEWSRPSDTENLALGIDCSRSIWYAFTRAGFPYNDGDRYLATVQMVGARTAMTQQFESCSGDAGFRIGDVLVYRDEGRAVGHTVMVIDPEKRIAWGSHGWDGNVREGLESDTGVEYQLIKYKKDWERWDRSDMQLKACWRYRGFAGTEERGLGAIATACDDGRQCGRVSVPGIAGGN